MAKGKNFQRGRHSGSPRQSPLDYMDGTILLVEDSPDDVFLQRAFEQAKIKKPMQVAKDGQQTIDYLNGSSQFADRQKYPLLFLILLDLKLPYVPASWC